MKTLIAALVATVAFAGVAAAQEAPQLIGNYSANVLQNYNGDSAVQHTGRHAVSLPAPKLDRMSTASIQSNRTVPRNYSANVTDWDLQGR